ncbi:MAG: GTPase HflX [Gammaproteobacteria bacterium]|nr:GTPase HflX [Gammaproteobacteria bacterium]
MFERPHGGERAVLVHLDIHTDSDKDELREFRELAVSAGAEPVAVVTGSRRTPDPKFFVGTGKAEEIGDVAEQEKADVVLVNHDLSPVQERNLERLLNCRVLDRTGLILDIFAQRARSHEGKLQVELAQLQHLSTRLVRGWTHLERQKGGIGLRGPGETQLETDRRLLGARIKQLKQKLEKVRRQREQGRRARKRAEIPTVSLVGYTNAGKSTLFNRLTESAVYAADQLFATLDPTLRRVSLPNGQAMVLADTVGFIRHLPHDLVEAFRSTLQETEEADLLLHVVDASSEERQANIDQVNLVLREIEAQSVPQLEIYNKIDQIEGMTPRIERNSNGIPVRVWVSALQGDGLELVLQAVGECLQHEIVSERVCLPPSAGRLHARIYQLGKVHHEEITTAGDWIMDVELARQDWDNLSKHDGLAEYILSTNQISRLAAGGEAP